MFIRDSFSLFFFNDTATTEIYTLSLHDALPIFATYLLSQWLSLTSLFAELIPLLMVLGLGLPFLLQATRDRKSTRLNSSHGYISYAVFCLKKKKKQPI